MAYRHATLASIRLLGPRRQRHGAHHLITAGASADGAAIAPVGTASRRHPPRTVPPSRATGSASGRTSPGSVGRVTGSQSEDDPWTRAGAWEKPAISPPAGRDAGSHGFRPWSGSPHQAKASPRGSAHCAGTDRRMGTTASLPRRGCAPVGSSGNTRGPRSHAAGAAEATATSRARCSTSQSAAGGKE